MRRKTRPKTIRRAIRPKTVWLTVKDAAKLLGVSRPTLRNWDRAGKLKARRHPINRYRLYDQRRLERVLRKLMGRK